MTPITPADVAHLKDAAETAWATRWQTAWDMNRDGSVSFADIWQFLSWVFFAPGDFLLLLLMLHATGVALFIGVSPQLLSGAISGAISSLVWILVLGFFGTRG